MLLTKIYLNEAYRHKNLQIFCCTSTMNAITDALR
jgi:hypothetical protein